jgi:uncharacterized membrane protein
LNEMNTATLARNVITAEDRAPMRGEEIAAVHALSRISSIDVLRGLIIVIMALDHVRDFFTDIRFSPMDLTQTNSRTSVSARWT